MSDDKPDYRLLHGADTHTFCERVSAALADGYVLHGSPSCTFNANTSEVIVAEAVIKPEHRPDD